MKKALAVVGATAIGVGTSTLAAAPAAADPVTEPCGSFSDHLLGVEELPDNWYMDCVPQYGLGKAEFAIHADDGPPPVEEFPDDFLPLTDPGVTATTTLDPGLLAYQDIFPGGAERRGAFAFIENTEDLPTSQTYIGMLHAPITGVSAVNLEEEISEELALAISDLCGPILVGYDGPGVPVVFAAEYGATDTTFTQTVDGEDWTYTITATPETTYFFLFQDPETGWVDEEAPFCVTDGIGAIGGLGSLADVDPEDPFNDIQDLFAVIGLAFVAPFPEDIFGGEIPSLDDFRFIGDFYRLVDAPEPEPEPAGPTLPATGSDAAGAMGLAGALALLGAGLASVAVLRRRSLEG